MELVQKLITGTVVAGGLGTTAYYSMGKSSGTTMEDYITSKSRKLISKEHDGKVKEVQYKKLEDKSEELIGDVENKDSKKTPVWKKLEKGCMKAKKKVFTSYEDKTYQHFSQWCTEENDIKGQLKIEGLREIEKFEEKEKEFNDPNKNLDSSFITGTGQAATEKGRKSVTESDLGKGCNSTKAFAFKHELDQTYLRVKKGCFDKKEQPKSVNQQG